MRDRTRRAASRHACAGCSTSFPTRYIEDKGASVAVHTRRLPKDMHERVFARADVLAVPWIAKNYVRRLEGNAVVEYLPNINGHKGEATKWITADVETKLQRAAPGWPTSAMTLRMKMRSARLP